MLNTKSILVSVFYAIIIIIASGLPGVVNEVYAAGGSVPTCTVDLNHNGTIETNESTQCTQNAQGSYVCPLDETKACTFPVSSGTRYECLKDLNNNGIIEPNETGICTQDSSGVQVCPIDPTAECVQVNTGSASNASNPNKCFKDTNNDGIITADETEQCIAGANNEQLCPIALTSCTLNPGVSVKIISGPVTLITDNSGVSLGENGCHFNNTAYGVSLTSSGGTSFLSNDLCGDVNPDTTKQGYVAYSCGGVIKTMYGAEGETITTPCLSNDFTLVDGYYYATNAPTVRCPSNTTDVSLPADATLSCSFDTGLPSATCPLGPDHPCVDVAGVKQCSPVLCVNPSDSTGGSVDPSTVLAKDDGWAPDGSCTGTISIFEGKASRCRPPGMRVGYINNCCAGDTVMDEDTGNTILDAVQTLKTVSDMVEVAMATYTAATTGTCSAGAAGASAAVTSGIAAGESAAAAGATTTSAIGSALTEYIGAALFNPATLVIAIVIMVVMKVLMGSGCDKVDIETTQAVKSNMCHYLGDYCEKTFFGSCVQKAHSYCCYNSLMAKLVNEQGRPQISTFCASPPLLPIVNGGCNPAEVLWGTPEVPSCRGFSAEEFQSIDFGRIDLSEYYAVVQKDMEAKLTEAKSSMATTIQNKVNAPGN